MVCAAIVVPGCPTSTGYASLRCRPKWLPAPSQRKTPLTAGEERERERESMYTHMYFFKYTYIYTNTYISVQTHIHTHVKEKFLGSGVLRANRI